MYAGTERRRKSTLFKTVLGFLKPMGGEILLDGKAINTLSRKEFAKIMAYVPQVHSPPFPFKVIDVVMMGRLPVSAHSVSPAAAIRK